MAAGSLNGKMRKGKFQKSAPPSNAEPGRQHEVSPLFPPHEMEEILDAAPPGLVDESRCADWHNKTGKTYTIYLTACT